MKHTVKQGKHDFTPNALPWPKMGDFTEALKLDLTASCWYDVTTFECKESWNKAGGVGRYLSKNNASAVLLAWRPAKERGLFEVSIYVNDSGGGWKATAPIIIRTSDTAVMILERRKDIVFARMEVHSADGSLFEPLSSVSTTIPGWLRRRGAWFGGQCPAPQDMELWTGWAKMG
jgi:hypothetical protein